MKKDIIFILLFMLISNSLFSIDFNTREDYGTVTFIRPNGIFGMAVNIEIIINQSAIVKLKRNSVSTINLDPGKYLIHLQPQEIFGTKSIYFDAFKLIIEPGKEVSIEVSPKMRGFNYEFLKTKPSLSSYEMNNEFEWIREIR